MEVQNTGPQETVVPAIATIIVHVLDENDNNPEFNSSSYTISVVEGSAVGQSVLLAQAVDSDSGTNAQLSYSIISNRTVPFVISASSGLITVNGTLDREVSSRYQFTVSVIDSSINNPLSATATVTVAITDANDNIPVLHNLPARIDLVENIPAGYIVLDINATDGDIGSNARITFTLISSTPAGWVSVNSIGVVYTLQPLDREQVSSIRVQFSVADGGLPAQSVNASITIAVEDLNDNVPVFNTPIASTETVLLTENTMPGQQMYAFNATDADQSSNASLVVYQLVSGNDNSTFLLSSRSGILTLSKGLDFESQTTFNLTVRATNPIPYSSMSLASETRDLLVVIRDVNEHHPVFSKLSYVVSVSESVTIGGLNVSLMASDPDGSSVSITYEIIAGNSAGEFQLDNTTGLLTNARPLDYEITQQYNLTVRARESAGVAALSRDVTVIVNVSPANEARPVFSQAHYTASVQENTTVGASVLQLQGNDSDAGTHGNLTYAITAGNDNATFTIDTLTGVIYLADSLDRESMVTFTLTATVMDQGNGASSANATITITITDVNDNSPVFAQFTNTLNVSLSSPVGSPIIQFSISDADIGTNALVTLSLVSGNTNDTFQITNQTGVLQLAKRLDRPGAVFSLLVAASDAGDPARVTSVNIMINIVSQSPLAPQFSSVLYSASINESLATGTVFSAVNASIAASASSGSGQLQYDLRDATVPFSVNAVTGLVSLNRSILGISQPLYTFLVRATATYSTSAYEAYTSVQVSVSNRLVDQRPVFTSPTSYTVSENASLGSDIATVQAIFVNFAGRSSDITYSISPLSSVFTINSSSGVMRVSAPLDRELVPSYMLTVRAQNPLSSVSVSTDQAVRINVSDVNDETPVFTDREYNATVLDSVSVGSVVAQLTVQDGDAGTNAAVVVSLASQPACSQSFRVAGSSTSINNTAVNIDTAQLLDVLNFTQCSLLLTVTDLGSPALSSSVNVSVVITDGDNHAPMFTAPLYNVSVLENATQGTLVTRVTATDLDTGSAGSVQYNITGGSGQAHFAINPSDGAIVTNAQLDTETTPSFTLQIAAFNPNSNRFASATAIVVIRVVNVNDHGPRFGQALYTALVSASVQPGYAVLQVTATDRDSPAIAFSISPVALSLFVMNASSGVLTARGGYNSSHVGQHTFSVLAVDNAIPPLSANTTVQVTILPANLAGLRHQDMVYSTSGLLVQTTISSSENSTSRFNLSYISYSDTTQVTVAIRGSSVPSLTLRQATPPLTATSLTATLITDDVYFDSPRVRVSLHAMDMFGDSRISSATGTVTIAQGTAMEQSGSCQLVSGQCIANLVLTADWFTARRSPSLSARLDTGDISALVAETITIHPQQNVTLSNDVLIQLPAYDHLRGDTLTVSAFAHDSFAISGFDITLSVGSALEVLHSVSTDSVWSAQSVVSTSADSVSVNAVLQPGMLPSPVASPPGATRLFQVQLRVRASAAENMFANLTATVQTLTNINNDGLQPGGRAVPTFVWFSDRLSPASPVGRVYIAQNDLVAVFAYLDGNPVFNMAALTGINQTYSVVARGVFRSAAVRVLTSSITCQSSSLSLIVASDCRSVSVSDQHSMAEHQALINVSVGTARCSFLVHLWQPQFPLQITLSTTTLSKIDGWQQQQPSCRARYQTATVQQVLANFTNGIDSPITVNVLERVLSRLSISNTSVMVLNSTTGILEGVAPGQTTLQLSGTASGHTIASVMCSVLDSSITISGIDVAVLTALSSSASVVNAPLSAGYLAFDWSHMFYFEGQLGYLHAAAVFSDNTRQILPAEDLRVSSLDTLVVVPGSSKGTVVVQQSSGAGELLDVALISNCSTDNVLVSAKAFINVTLPLPTSVSILGQVSRITFSGDPSTRRNIPTAMSLQVALVFASGVRQDMVSDSRTLFNFTSGSTLVSGSVQSGRFVVQPTQLASGPATLTIGFSHLPASYARTVTFTIVQATAITTTASPFPTYSGSSSLIRHSVHPIASTGVFQEALLASVLHLSDGSTRSVSDIVQYSKHTVGLPDSNVTITGSGASRRVLVTDHTVPAGTLTINATLLQLTSAVPLVLSVSRTPVVVQSLSLTSNPSQLTGLRSQVRAQVIVQVIFNDTAQYPVFSTSVRPLPGLLNLSLSNPSVASIDSSTGTVILLGNSLLSPVRITAQDTSSAISNTVDVPCNLDPDSGDVDMGQRNGLALSLVTVGYTYSIPIYVNTANLRLGSWDFHLSFNSTLVRVAQRSDITRGNDWPSAALFDGVANDPVSEVRFGGSVASVTVVGSRLHLATVTVTAIASGTSFLALEVVTLKSQDVPARDIGAATPRQSAAADGLVLAVMSSSVGRRSVEEDLLPQTTGIVGHRRSKRQATTACSIPPCPASQCTGGERQLGDTNGDCLFDVSDVTFVQQYLASKAQNFMDSNGATIKTGLDTVSDRLVELDADGNGVIDVSDARYLLLVNFGLLRFMRQLNILPVQGLGSNCSLTLQVRLLNKGDVPVDGRQTTVAFLLASNEIGLGVQLASYALNVSQASGPSLAVLPAVFVGDGTFRFSSPVNFTSQTIGVSLLQVTFDALGGSSVDRQLVTRGNPSPPFLFNTPVSLNIMATPSVRVSFIASNGFNPEARLNNTLTTAVCRVQSARVLVISPALVVQTVLENTVLPAIIFNVSVNSTLPPSSPYQLHFTLPNDAVIKSHFVVNSSTASAVILTTIRPFDREAIATFTFTVSVSTVIDGVLLTADANVRVTVLDVNDNAPQFTVGTPANITLSAHMPPGDPVFNVSAIDLDLLLNARFNFSLSGSNAFRIDSDGQVYTTDLLLEKDVYIVNITAFDTPSSGHSLATTTVIVVSVPDVPDVLSPPIFEMFNDSLAVPENSPLNMIIATFAANTRSNFSKVYYLSSLQPLPVQISATTGELTVTGALNYEKTPVYNITVHVTRPGLDRFGAANNSRSFLLQVTDINEPPVFNVSDLHPVLSIKANTWPQTVLGDFLATDQDSGLQGQLAYSILATSAPPHFFTISQSGILSTDSVLLNSSGQYYTLQLLVSDGGNPSLTDDITVNITVNAVDAPTFDQSEYMMDIPENSAVSTPVGSVLAVGDNATVTYSIISGNGRGSFSIEPLTGNITVSQDNIDAEQVLAYSLTVLAAAYDLSTQSNLSTSVSVNIRVLDENDNMPVFDSNTLNFSIVENTPLHSILHTVSATDRDVSPQNSLVSFTLLDLITTFRINASTGVVENLVSIDRETTPFFTANVSAADNGMPSLSSDGVMQVTVLDVNDNAPKFHQAPSVARLDDTAVVGEPVARFIASDPDLGSNGTVIFSLGVSSLQSQQIPVSVNATSGELTVSASLHDLNVDQFSVQVVASDQGHPALSSTAMIVIHVAALALTPTLSATGGLSVVQGVVSNTSAMSYTSYLGLITGPSGEVRTTFGSLSASRMFSYASDPPATVQAAMLSASTQVFCTPTGSTCRAAITIAAQVKAAYFKTLIRSPVYVRIQGSSLTAKTSSCMSVALPGVCTVTITLQKSDFPTAGTSPASASISFGLSPQQLTQSLETVQLQPLPSYSVADNNVFVELSREPVYRGDAFEVRVSSQTADRVEGFNIKCTSGPGLQISSSIIIDQAWDYQMSQFGASLSVPAFIPATATSRPAFTAGRTHLFSLQLTVTQSASLGSNTSVQCSVSSLVTELGQVQPSGASSPFAAITFGQFGRSTAGLVSVDADAVVAVFADVDSSELVNTAVVTGQPVLSTMTVVAGYVSGRTTGTTGQASCTSNSTSVASVDASCAHVILNGMETAGSHNARIGVSVGSVTTSVSIIVWHPTSFKLSTDDDELSLVSSWRNAADGCNARYQQTALRVSCTFSNGQVSIPGVDITDTAKSYLRVDKPTVVSLNGSIATGIMPGSVAAALPNPVPSRPPLASLPLLVTSSAPVSVVGLSISVVSRLDLTLNTPTSRSMWVPAAAPFITTRLIQDLNLEGKMASLIVAAHFSDGQAQIVTQADGVVLSSLNTAVLTVAGQTVSTRGSGSGELILATLSSGQCDVRILANGTAMLNIVTPAPVRAELFASTTRLTLAGDALRQTGVQSRAQITSNLVFSTSSGLANIPMTSDTRTVYTLSNSLFILTRNADGSVEVSGNGSVTSGTIGTGTTDLVVSFVHTNLTAVVTLQLVLTDVVQLASHPYPSYTGSGSHHLSVLSPLANTGVYQQATMRIQLVTTDKQIVDVSAHNRTDVYIEYSTDSLLSEQLRRTSSNEFQLSVSPSQQANGDITIGASFDGDVANFLLIEVSTTPVEVVSLRIHSLPRNTLRGMQLVTQHQLTVAVTFSDSTQHPNYLSASSPALPNLLRFTSNSYANTTGMTTGVITPRINSPLDAALVTAIAMPTPQCGSNCTTVSHTLPFTVNLDPAIGDVDIGQASGVALPVRRTDTTFTAAVRVNSGSSVVNMLDCLVIYDSAVLSVSKVSEGTSWSSRVSCTLNYGDPGEIRATCSDISSGAPRGTSLNILIIEFMAKAPGMAHVSGMVNTISTYSGLNPITIGAPTPQPFIAGDFFQVVSANRQRRFTSPSGNAVPVIAERHRRNTASATSTCTSISCATCTAAREIGDTNGDCSFDANDVTFTLIYLAERGNDFRTTRGQALANTLLSAQVEELDANEDGTILIDDARFLSEYLVDFIYALVPPISIVPVSSLQSQCMLTVSVKLARANAMPISNQTRVVVHLSHENESFAADFTNQSTVVQGQLLAVSGDTGVLVETAFSPDQQVFSLALDANFELSNIGMSLLEVTQSTTGTTSLERQHYFYQTSNASSSPSSGIDASLTVAGHKVTVRAGTRSQPLMTFDNLLSSRSCSDNPLLADDLRIEVHNGTSATVQWEITNPRQVLQDTFNLTLTILECDLMPVGPSGCQDQQFIAVGSLNDSTPCRRRLFDVSGLQASLTVLSPHTATYFQVSSLLPSRSPSSAWVLAELPQARKSNLL